PSQSGYGRRLHGGGVLVDRHRFAAVWKVLSNPRMLALSLVYFGTSAGLDTLGLWVPMTLRQFGFSPLATRGLNAMAGMAAVAGMVVWARYSERTLGRTWACGPSLRGCLSGLYLGRRRANGLRCHFCPRDRECRGQCGESPALGYAGGLYLVGGTLALSAVVTLVLSRQQRREQKKRRGICHASLLLTAIATAGLLLNRDVDRLRLGHFLLGKRNGQHAVPVICGDLFGVHRIGQAEGPDERAVGPLDPMKAPSILFILKFPLAL
ncbi:MAG TPA: hypothetical protein VLJ11_01720, partial [Bryobacteraceae bacterium]|nr:hypothetical protein [Bryobacteraceae bacterium]